MQYSVNQMVVIQLKCKVVIATVCYAHFFIFQYSTATYAKQETYRLKAVDTFLLSCLFTYIAV